MDTESNRVRSPENQQQNSDSISAKTYLICFVAVLLPGLGHAILKKWDRAIVFFSCIFFMFAFGLYLQGELFAPSYDSIFSMMKFIADAGSGLFYWVSWLRGFGAGDPTAYAYGYANVFLYVAGLLNMLVVIDVFDIAMGRKQ